MRVTLSGYVTKPLHIAQIRKTALMWEDARTGPPVTGESSLLTPHGAEAVRSPNHPYPGRASLTAGKRVTNRPVIQAK